MSCMATCVIAPLAQLFPPPLNSNQWALLQPGHLSEQVDRASETATEDLAPRPRYSEPAKSQIYWTSWSGFIHGWRNEKKKDEESQGERESVLFFPHPHGISLFLPLSPLFFFLLSANSIPFQSPSERSENASYHYITYAVYQSDRVWITLSMTPKSWRYQTLGLHGIAVTTSGSLGWTGSLSADLTEWSLSLHGVRRYLVSSKHDSRLCSLPAKHEKAATFPFYPDSPFFLYVSGHILSFFLHHCKLGFFQNLAIRHRMNLLFYMHAGFLY